MPWHHIIPRHEWKKRFGNFDGFNVNDNLVNLSLENHTQIHMRYGLEGSRYDLIAGKAMMGLIDHEEARLEAVRVYNKSEANSIQARGNKNALGSRGSKEKCEAQSKRMLGNTRSKGNRFHHETVECPHCHRVGGQGGMVRWHFDKCKRRILWK